MQLRPYQQLAIDNIRDAFRRRVRRVLLVSPTGSGKTVMFCYITKGAIAKNKRVTILVHRTELIDQVSDALTSLGVRHGVIAPGFPMLPALPVQVASVFTLVKRLHKYDPPDLLVVDEAHHTVASTWEKVTDAYPDALVLGVTATPCRASGAGLDTSFDEMILGPTAMELIDLGALSPLRVYAPPPAALEGVKVRMGDYVTGQLAKAVDKPKITGDALDHYQKLTPGAPAVVFCVSVDHARHVSGQFMGAGINAISIDGTMDRSTRKSIIADYRAGKIMVLTSCDLVSEGFDVPGIITGISLRPTKSLGLWIQQTGRILRTMEGKKEAFLLDHAGNCMQHGLPIDDREWSLAGQDKEDKPKQTIKTCKVCYAINPVSASVCKECGQAFAAEAKPRELVQQAGELVELDVAAMRKKVDPERAKARTLEGLRELGKQRGYAPGWADHIFAARQKKLEQQQGAQRTGQRDPA
ncbi:MAG: DEAD/DEAH box helicase [Steroidobacteraceae bacterium]